MRGKLKLERYYKIDIRVGTESLEKYPRLHMWLIYLQKSLTLLQEI